MNRRNVIYAVIFLSGFLFVGIIQTVIAGDFLGAGPDNRRILNIIAFPFHILQLAFLFLAIYYSGETKFSRDSFWFYKENTFCPTFVSARTFRMTTLLPIVLLLVSFNFFIDWYMKSYLENYTVILNNLLLLIFAPIVSRWTGLFLNKFENAVEEINHIFKEEKKFKNYQSMLKKEIFSRKEIFYALLLLTIIRVIEIIFPNLSWTSAGGYTYPLIPLWWALVAVPFWNLICLLFVSVLHSYYRFSKSLFPLVKGDGIKINLFHPDGCSGLKTIVDFAHWMSSRLLIAVAAYSFGCLIFMSFFPQGISTGLVIIIFVVNVVSFLILVLPLVALRRLVKKRKKQERELVMNRIRQKEEIILQKENDNTSKNLDDLRNLFLLVDRIDSVDDWLIGKKIKLNLVLRIIVGSVPIIFEFFLHYFWYQ